jgi:protein-disulfide isomerase
MARVRRKAKQLEEEQKSNNMRQIIGGGVLVLLLLLVGGLLWVGLGGSPTIETAIPEQEGQVDGTFLGSAEAPVVVKDFSDFRCPHCKDASTILIPKIIENYVKAGQVRLEFIPVFVTGEEALYAGQASYCAAAQNKFWPYHDKLFQRQGRDQFNIANLTSFATDLGIEEQEFRDCILSGKYAQQMQDNNAEFQRSGGTGTPTFMVGDELVGGAVAFDEMKKIIEGQLAQSE